MSGLNEVKKIIRNRDVLSEDYIPSEIHSRDSQKRELQICLEPAIRGYKSIHTFIYGPSGTGKTLIAKALLRDLKERSINGAYINCWEHQSLYSIIDKIIEDFRILNAEKQNTIYKMEKFEKFLNDKPFILILDNIDRLDPKDIDFSLYNLCDLRKTGLVCIGYSMDFLQKLEDRVKSRLNPRIIEGPAYSKKELLQILKERAEIGLETHSWDDRILKKIVNLANGDARMAVQTLGNAANYAENERSPRIKIKDLERGWIDAKELKINEILDNLGPHHRVILEVIQGCKEAISSDLWHEYKKACRRKKIKIVPFRTFAYYRDQLINSGLIISKRARIRGNVRIYSANKRP